MGFVLFLTLSEAVVALPLTTHTTAFIADYYAAHRWLIVAAQIAVAFMIQ